VVDDPGGVRTTDRGDDDGTEDHGDGESAGARDLLADLPGVDDVADPEQTGDQCVDHAERVKAVAADDGFGTEDDHAGGGAAHPDQVTATA